MVVCGVIVIRVGVSIGDNHRSWFHVHCSPCSLSDRRSIVGSSGLSVEALRKWSVGRVVGLCSPIPQECESFSANTGIDGTVELDIKSCSVTSLEVSEPVKVDSTSLPGIKVARLIGSGALDEANLVATAVGEGLGGGDLPVVVGSGRGALGEVALSANLVADQGCGALGLDVGPIEVVPGARVFPVSDAGELVRLALRLFVRDFEVAVDRNRHVDLLAIPGLLAGLRSGNVHAETVLEELAKCALDESDSVTMVLIGVLAWNLGDVGPHVELDGIVVAAVGRVDEAGVESVVLVATVVVASKCGVIDGVGGGSEECESERFEHFFLKTLFEIEIIRMYWQPTLDLQILFNYPDLDLNWRIHFHGLSNLV